MGEIVAALRLKPGDVVADFGAGTGAFSFPLAKEVGPAGKVYSVEIEQGLLDHISARAMAEGVSNVRTVLGKFEDPALPASDVDLGFFHDVLHHIPDRAGYLKNVARYVKPGGRVVVIEPLNTHRNQPELQVSPEQVGQWMKAAGFGAAEAVNLFPESWFVIYSRNVAWRCSDAGSRRTRPTALISDNVDLASHRSRNASISYRIDLVTHRFRIVSIS